MTQTKKKMMSAVIVAAICVLIRYDSVRAADGVGWNNGIGDATPPTAIGYSANLEYVGMRIHSDVTANITSISLPIYAVGSPNWDALYIVLCEYDGGERRWCGDNETIYLDHVGGDFSLSGGGYPVVAGQDYVFFVRNPNISSTNYFEWPKNGGDYENSGYGFTDGNGCSCTSTIVNGGDPDVALLFNTENDAPLPPLNVTLSATNTNYLSGKIGWSGNVTLPWDDSILLDDEYLTEATVTISRGAFSATYEVSTGIEGGSDYSRYSTPFVAYDYSYPAGTYTIVTLEKSNFRSTSATATVIVPPYGGFSGGGFGGGGGSVLTATGTGGVMSATGTFPVWDGTLGGFSTWISDVVRWIFWPPDAVNYDTVGLVNFIKGRWPLVYIFNPIDQWVAGFATEIECPLPDLGGDTRTIMGTESVSPTISLCTPFDNVGGAISSEPWAENILVWIVYLSGVIAGAALVSRMKFWS